MALDQAKEKVCQLENAIKKLDLIKKHLNHTASDIKAEIHSCVSHNLESLRGREVSLLNKVDEIVSLKEDALQQQQAKLNQALGVLQTRMALMTTDTASDKQMADVLTKFTEMDLSPGETPHIAFRADHMSLRESILQYGRVDSNALPSAFDNPKKPSASLPSHLEEYEDADHHIFYKTVGELEENNSTERNITVTIPKMSINDWLQKRQTDEKRTILPLIQPTVLQSGGFTGWKSPIQSYPVSKPGDTCSLNNWLSQIKSHSDLEEEHNFEIVDNSLMKDQSGSFHFKYDNLKPWLYNSPDYMENLRTAHKQSLNLFQHISSDSKVWLHQSSQQIPLSDGIKQNLFHHISKEPSTWLRSRAHGKQTSHFQIGQEDGKIKSVGFQDRDLNQWLSQNDSPKRGNFENKNGNNSNCCKQTHLLHSLTSTKQERKVSSISFELEDICKANELCSSLVDCVCSPNCAIIQEQKISGVKNPVDPTKNLIPLELPMSQWLSTPEEKNNYGKMELCKNEQICNVGDDKGMFSHISHLSSDQWLFKHSDQSSEHVPSIPSTTFKHCKEETNLWLQQRKESSLTNQENNAKMLLNFNPSNRSLSDWLLPTKEKVISKEEEEENEVIMNEESEGWSLCSTPSSLNSEQFGKDVKIATSYIQDWIL